MLNYEHLSETWGQRVAVKRPKPAPPKTSVRIYGDEFYEFDADTGAIVNIGRVDELPKTGA